MQNRTLLLLQSLIAACVWSLVALASWSWIFEVRDAVASPSAGEISRSTLIGAGAVVALSIALLAIALERFYRFTQAPRTNAEL